MFDICVFDLDDTLIKTEDVKGLREAYKNESGQVHLDKVIRALNQGEERRIYSPEFLQRLRQSFPKLKLAVFTRSPKSYAKTALKWAYPAFKWDIVVAYEDVKQTKPHGDGLDKIMNEFGIRHLDHVMMVGDTDVDIRAAYNCGCVAVLDISAWPNRKLPSHWRSLGLCPDAIISNREELFNVLNESGRFLPELERALDGSPVFSGPRFDKINHFVAKAVGGDNTPFPIHCCGRSFSKHQSVQYRRQWHALTKSIDQNKSSDEFPDEWTETVRTFIMAEYLPTFRPTKLVVTVIPHRPKRKPRLEKFLAQFAALVNERPIKNATISVEPQLLGFKDSVKSQHNDYLSRDDRFINMRDHLFVRKADVIKPGVSFLVIDDVTTTGASLIYADKYLKMAGAADVKCLSMAKNIGDVL